MKFKKEMKLDRDARVVVRNVSGDLKLRSQDGQTLTILSRDEGLEVERSGRDVVIVCEDDCRIRVPSEAAVVIETVGGDAAISDRRLGAEIGNVGGDLSLRRSGSSLVRGVGSDLLVKDLHGDLSVKTVGGDCWIGRIEGQTRLEAIGGDGSFNRLGGSLRAMLGGDATLNLREGVQGSAQVNAGGDIVCRLPEQASVSVTLTAGDGIRSRIPEAESVSGRTGQFILGDGDYKVDLSAGGNIWIGSGTHEGPDADFDDIGADLASKIEGMVAEAQVTISAMEAKSIRIDGESVGEKVRKVVDRAVRRSQVGGQMAALESVLEEQFARPSSKGVSDDERLQVLRMVEAKKITVEEAEVLLEALGESG